MAHFFGWVLGQAGEATRLGSKRSGMEVFAQTDKARVKVELAHNTSGAWANVATGGKRVGKPNEDGEGDIAHVLLDGGRATYYRQVQLGRFNLNNVAAALDSRDPKVMKIVERIQNDFERLNTEAPKALRRAERKRVAEEKRQQRAREEREVREREFAATVTDAEVAHFLALVLGGPDEQERADFGYTDENIRLRIAQEGYAPEHKPERDERGHLIIVNGHGSFNMKRYDLTDGIELDREKAAA